MKLAWNNLLHDRIRFGVTVAGIAFAVFLMIFQGSLLISFLYAASKVIDATSADIWITARGVSCFDFPASLPKRFLEIAKGVSGVEQASSLMLNYAEFRKPDGHTQTVAVVGVEAGPGQTLPLPYLGGSTSVVQPASVLVDRSHAALLGVTEFPREVEINRLRAQVAGQVEGFSSFLGNPFVFTSYQDASRYLSVSPEETSYILVHVKNGRNIETVRSEIQQRLSDVDVLTREQFARRSQMFWITQTGAGGAILTAALLGFVIGLVVASQTIYATTMENLEEYATLKAIGATSGYVTRVVLMQAMICGVAGCMVGLIATQPIVEIARNTIAWLKTPVWLPWVMLPPGLLMCALAAIISVRAALTVEPARVFRA
ncbi:MAG TPA: ABC transporter permease [Bryobacteraceae bacterium]|nr:ABC transporter permease [Bryobacteraceae bacterium]